MAKKSEYYYQSFKETYTTDFPFIKKSNKGTGYAFCVYCRSDFKISHGGRTDITSHANRQKHKDNVIAAEKSKKMDFLLQQNTNFEKSVITSECLFTSFILEHNLPITCADHAGPLFRKMFPDSKITKSYSCARTKTSNPIKEMASSKELLLNESLRISPFTLAVDRNNDTDSKLYPIVVTYFNTNLSKIDCTLLCMPCLESSATGINIGNLILKSLEAFQIPITNCLALSCDNAPVMIGEKSGVITVLKKTNENICALGCCCHLINLAAEKGSASLPFKIDEILVDIYYYLEKSSNRKERLKELQKLCDNDVHKILKHVCTRWLSVNTCLTRLVEQWLPVTTFFKEECNKQKNTNSISFYHIPKKMKTELSAKTSEPVPVSQSACPISESKAKNASKLILKTTSEYSSSMKKIENGNKPKIKSTCSVSKSKATNASKSLLKTTSACSSSKRKVENAGKSMSKIQSASSISKSKVATKRKANQLTKIDENYLAREERIFYFLSSNYNKALCCFLLNSIGILDKTNVFLQSQSPQIHVLRTVLLDLFRDILIRFVKPEVIKECASYLDVDYQKVSNQKSDCDLIIGNDTNIILENLSKSEKNSFFTTVRQYFCIVCNYMRLKFPFYNEIILNAEVANLEKNSSSFSQLNYFLDKYPGFILGGVCGVRHPVCPFDEKFPPRCLLILIERPDT